MIFTFNKNRLTGFLIIIFVFAFWVNHSFSSTNSTSSVPGIKWDMKGMSGSYPFIVNSGDHQAWRGRVTAHLEGHGSFGGSGGKGGISACLSNSTAMWTGSCWTIVDSNGEGNIGDGFLDVTDRTRDIGSDYNPNFTWWVVNFYANDATWDPITLTVDGRKVSIDSLSAPGNVTIGQRFTVSWTTDQTMEDPWIYMSGSGISCDHSNGQQVSPDGSTGCILSQAGTGEVRIEARGPSSSGPTTVTRSVFINASSACGNGVIDSGEQCDGGNLNGQTCSSLGYSSGSLSCNSNCTFNTSSCSNAPTLDFWADSTSIPYNNSTTLHWNSANTTSCGGYDDWSFGSPGLSGSTSTGNLTSSKKYTIGCSGPGGTIYKSVTISVGSGPVNGSCSSTHYNCNAGTSANNVDGASSWTWTCNGLNGGSDASCSETKPVSSVPTVDIKANGSDGPITVPSGSNVTLSWTSTNATDCSWGGAWPPSGSYTISNVTSSFGATMTCTGPGGTSAPDSVTVNVGAAPINGSCSSTHYNCNAGTSANNVDGASSWTWTCNGLNGGSNASCSEAKLSTFAVNSVTISSPTVRADNSTQYNIVIRATSPLGASNIAREYTLINYQGENAGQYRGFLTWDSTNVSAGYPDNRACSGTGYGAVVPAYGSGYIHLDSCSVSDSGDSRSTTFTVRFDPSFTTPVTDNDISGYAYRSDGAATDWVNFQTDFNLLPPETLSASLTANPSSGTSPLNVNLTANSSGTASGYTNFSFWWNCTDPTTSVAAAASACGSLLFPPPGSCYENSNGYKCNSLATVTLSAPSQIPTHAYTSSSTAKVIIERGTAPPAQAQATVTVSAPAPTVDIKANGSDGPITVPYNTSVTLSWTSTNTTSCTVTSTSVGGPWSGTSNSGTTTPGLTTSTAFALNCSGPGGSASENVTVNVSAPTLSVSLSASPSSGISPLGVALNANISGSATGTINYSFWYDCGDSTKSVLTASSVCGSLPAPSQGTCSGNSVGYKCDGVSGTTQSASTTYVTSGAKTPKVIIERGSASPAQAQTDVAVSAPAPTVDIKANSSDGPISIPFNSTVSLSWTSTNTTSCTASGDWSGSKSTSSSQSVGPLATGNYTYTLICTGPGGTSAPDSVIVAVGSAAPIVDLKANSSDGPVSIPYNTSATLSWTSTNTTSCTASGAWSGSKSTSGSTSTGNLTSSQTYTLTCSGPGGSDSDSVTINVGAASLSVFLSANPGSGVSPLNVNLSGDVSGSAIGTINYSFWYNCGDSTTSVFTASSVCGSLPAPSQGSCSGNSVGYKCNGVSNTTQSASTTYTTSGTKTPKVIVERGTASPAQAQTDVAVVAPASPFVDLDANSSDGPISISYNTPATLSWTSTNTTSCTASGAWSGSKSTSGSTSTGNLTSSQTYTLTCSGPGGSDSDSVTVNVGVAPVSADIKANDSDGPISISYNTSANISWTSSDATSCTVSPSGWTGTSNSGISTGNLTSSRTYTLNCSGPGGSASDSVTVNVGAAPAPTVSNVTVSQPNYCLSGPAATVNWTYSDPSGSPQSAYRVQIDNDSSFNSPEWDSCPGGPPNGTCASGNSSTSNSTPQGILQFNTTYGGRVMVWNNFNTPSSWVTSSNWKTPNNAYPQVNFSWTPNEPRVSQPVQFTDQTQFFDSVGGHTWNWIFGDGGSSTSQNPQHTYSQANSYNVTLTATDSQNQSCSLSKQITIQRANPIWKEVNPGK